jgi:hypothetical protein
VGTNSAVSVLVDSQTVCSHLGMDRPSLSSSFFLLTSLVSEAPYINLIAWVFMGRPSVRRNLMKIAIKLAMMGLMRS